MPLIASWAIAAGCEASADVAAMWPTARLQDYGRWLVCADYYGATIDMRFASIDRVAHARGLPLAPAAFETGRGAIATQRKLRPRPIVPPSDNLADAALALMTNK